MVVAVTYQGIVLAREAPARPGDTPHRLFVECAQPMPVGTRVEVTVSGGEPRQAKVVRVLESPVPAGMTVEWVGMAVETVAHAPTPAVANEPAPPVVKKQNGTAHHDTGKRKKRR
jgi:hypothetical protein